MPDPDTDIDETLSALSDLVHAGKIRSFGTSKVPASAIIGPRTMEHLDSYLAADGIELPGDLLDRIDQIVPPAVTINVADNMWNLGTPALDTAFRRR